jgi:hypothetical protein
MKRTQVIKPTSKQLRSFIVETATVAQEKLEEQRLAKLAKGVRLNEAAVRRIIKEEVRRANLINRLRAVLKESKLLGEGDAFASAFDKVMAGKAFQDLSNDEIEAAVGQLADRFNASDDDIDAALDKLGITAASSAGEDNLGTSGATSTSKGKGNLEDSPDAAALEAGSTLQDQGFRKEPTRWGGPNKAANPGQVKKTRAAG